MNKQPQLHSARLQYLINNHQQHLLGNGLKGIEKESLRISRQGMISQTDHPVNLGSALTHPHITTDYSEALLEFITPPFSNINDTLKFMDHIHRFVYDHLDDEMLLSASMPCGINGDESIRIAEYGTSNIGRMKHVYRKGLWHRYGRTMQSIAGIHFNYSVPEALWPVLLQQSGRVLPLQDFISDAYFGLMRNFQRQGWVLLYLFGASPAICKSFFKSRPHLMEQFEEFDAYTLYHPYATSLRMSDIGYKSKNQENLEIDCNSLHGYVDSLTQAIETTFPDYQKIGIKKDGKFQQLNANILQIENEYYSTIRPKQIAESGEKPTLALKRRGVRYIEIRSLDLDVFNPIGIDESKSCFIEAFLLHCLLENSPMQSAHEQQINNENQLRVANQGRKPGLELNRNGQEVLLTEWAHEILKSMQMICEILDQDQVNAPYTKALKQYQRLLDDPTLTPSAKMLVAMEADNQPFGRFGLNISAEHQLHFKTRPLEAEKNRFFEELVKLSHAKQRQIETKNSVSFEQFLEAYFAQK